MTIVQTRRHLASLALLLALLIIASACSMPESALSADQVEPTTPKVLASIGQESITEQEIAERMVTELMQVERQKHEILERGLDEFVFERLLAIAAEQRGISVEALLQEEVLAKVVEPTNEEIDAFYEERKDQIPQPKEEVAEQIRVYLRRLQQGELQEELIARLKDEHAFRSFMEPFRLEVETAGSPSRGPEQASVTIVEFSDFECPYCARITPTLERIFDQYGDRVRLVFRQFPLLSIHPNAQKAAEASLCAADQGKFWEMHDLMFKEQRSLEVEQLKEKAARLGLVPAEFNECLDTSRHAERVSADLEAGTRLGVSGTPALFVNGRFLSGAQPFEEIAQVIDEELQRVASDG